MTEKLIRFEGRVCHPLNPVARVFVDNNEILAFRNVADSSKRSVIALVTDEYGNPVEHDDGMFPDAWSWEQITGEIKIFLLKDVLTNERCIRNKLFTELKG